MKIQNLNSKFSLSDIKNEDQPYCVSCWDEYNQDGYSYFSTEEEAREYAESLKSKVESISIDLVDNDGIHIKNIMKWN